MLYPDFNELLSFKDWGLKAKIKNASLTSSLPSGASLSSFRGRGLDFDSVRKYVLGDDIRSIDWKVTARMGTAHLKLFQEEREKTLFLIIDMSASMAFGTRGTFKSIQAAKAAAWLGWQGLKMQASVGAYLFGAVKEGIRYFPPQKRSSSFSRILYEIAQASSFTNEIDEKTKEKEIWLHLSQKAPKGSSIYFISDFLEIEKDPSFSSRLPLLSRLFDLTFISINDPADHTMLPIPSLNLRDLQGNSLAIDGGNRAGQSAFQEAWKKNRQTLKEMTKTNDISLIELKTQSDLPRELFFKLSQKRPSKMRRRK